MNFEWDDNKNRTNKRIHHISFEYAARVWTDEKRLVKADVEHSEYEDRWKVIGLIDRVIVVIYVEKSSDLVRIISARKATKEEQNEYYHNYDFR